VAIAQHFGRAGVSTAVAIQQLLRNREMASPSGRTRSVPLFGGFPVTHVSRVIVPRSTARMTSAGHAETLGELGKRRHRVHHELLNPLSAAHTNKPRHFFYVMSAALSPSTTRNRSTFAFRLSIISVLHIHLCAGRY
jgi:hypothetical protein